MGLVGWLVGGWRCQKSSGVMQLKCTILSLINVCYGAIICIYATTQLKSQCRKNAERLEVASRPVEAEYFPFFFLSPRVKTRRVDQGNGFKELELEDEAEA